MSKIDNLIPMSGSPEDFIEETNVSRELAEREQGASFDDTTD
ncbi:MAG: hypothetical protein RLY95_36 [Pseudomonadota bacterium]|jgi:hypothetical protein